MWDHLEADVEALFHAPSMWDYLETGVTPDGVEWGGMVEAYVAKRSGSEPCPGCGKDFENKRKGWLRSYCSDACRKAHHNRRQTLERRATRRGCTLRACEQCGGKFMGRATGGKPQRYCTEKCGRKARRAKQ